MFAPTRLTRYLLYSGCHPFDNERNDASERWIDHIQESHEVENSQQPSQQYLRGEARLKAKIARGMVEFSHDWIDFPAGWLLLPFSLALRLLTLRSPRARL